MSKFYIYAGGRWCEVETRRGRVEGFRERARFCYLRGGRLHAARSAAVLRALRALAAGAPGAARDAAPLPPLPRRRSRSRRRSRRAPPSTHAHHCCAHVHSGCKAIATGLPPPITPVSPILSAPPQPSDPQRKRRRISSSEETPITKSPVKTKTPLKRQKIKNTEKSDCSSVEEKQQVTTRSPRQRDVVVESSPSRESEKVSEKSPAKQKTQARVVDSSSHDEDQTRGVNKTRSVQKSPKKRTVNLELSSDHDLPKPTLPPLKPHMRATRHNIAKVNETLLLRSVKKEIQVVDSSSDADTKKPVPPKENAQAPQGKSEVTTNAQKLVQMLLESSSEESSGSSRGNAATQPRERCKELLICESDVSVLRRYLARTGSGRATLSRFDNDERYKVRIFHRLNPLVTLERCQPLENLLRQRVSLKEFARNLGLRSVADATPEKLYKMRRSARKVSVSDIETDKENVIAPKKRKLWNNNKALFSVRSTRSSELRPRIPKPAVDGDSSQATSDSDTEFKRRVREQLKKKSILHRRDSLADAARRRTRSTGRPSQDQTNKPFTNSVDGEGNSAKMEKELPGEVRQTRRSGKISTNPSTFIEPHKPVNECVTDKMKLKLARVSRSMEESEWEVVSKQTTSSNADSAIPVRTLREQNNESDDAFEPSKSSPKKGNFIKKDKPVANKGSPFKRKDAGNSGKALDKDSGQKPNDAEAKVASSMTVKPVKFKKSSVANGREYTSLEDHAIVAWLSSGGRERLVNGNQVWRELAPEYQRLTGQSRSWHSLRNRYLRYVLPALPALALPPAQVRRLRAAAATGVIKGKSARARRNSIFAAPPVRSASARRAAPAQPAPPAQPAHSAAQSAAPPAPSAQSAARSAAPSAPSARSAAPPDPPRASPRLRPPAPPASAAPPARRPRSAGGQPYKHKPGTKT